MAGLERYSAKTLRTFAIGDIGPGGGVVFITPSTSGNTTGKYFEAAPSGWSGSSFDPSRSWAQSSPVNYQSTAVTGADGTSIGTGYQNTLDIIAQGNGTTSSSAAALARSYSNKGKDDWFLPSKDEIYQMYLNFSAIPGLTTVNYYWSSTESTSTNSFVQDMASGGASGALAKSLTWTVRPVRMFSVEYSSSVQRIGNDSIYGQGTDGNTTIASNTSLTRDMYYNNLTVNNGIHLNTNGYRVFVKGTLTLNGNIGVASSQSVSSGTLSGRLALASGNTSVSLGGNSGGNTFIASQLSDSDKKNFELLISGVVLNSSGTVTSIKGGASGANGANGTVTPATAGGTGTLSRNPLVPGGPGTAGTTPPASAGGTGGAGGAIVLVVAKQITGSGTILSQGQGATVGANSSTGSAGSAANTATLTHLTDGSALYRTGDGTTGPFASVSAPNVPHGGHQPSTQNRLHGYTYRYVHQGNTHHTHNQVYGDWHADHGTHNPPFGHHYGDFNDTPHVDGLTGTYYAINNIPHNHGHRNHSGIAFTFEYSHYSGAFGGVNDTPHHSFHDPGYHDGKLGHFPASHGHRNYPRHHYDNNHSHFRARNAGTVSSQGSVGYPGGTAGAAGSSTAGGSGITGGGGGIIIITDAIANTVVTSTTGGTISGGSTGQSGTVLTILNQ
jgi:hypothetical protein